MGMGWKNPHPYIEHLLYTNIDIHAHKLILKFQINKN